MALSKDTIEQLAEHLEACQLQVRDTPKITDEHPGLAAMSPAAMDEARERGRRAGRAAAPAVRRWWGGRFR